MRTTIPPTSLLSFLLLLITCQAQRLVDSLSFNQPISPNGRGIPGWSVTSSNHHVQILSDRVILTPPITANTKGAMWTDGTIASETWSAEMAFRASGQDTGSGSINVWFVKDKEKVSVDSVYSVQNFDGLAIIVDQYAGGSGSIRGFLNDGGLNFYGHPDLASVAFGKCNYAYRNLGIPSSLRITSHDGLTVTIDGQPCFSSDKISLPSSYYFGITAAAGEEPDSFEVHSFKVESGIPHQHQNVLKGGPPPLQKLDKFPGAPEAVPDQVADEVKGTDAQFADLHNRLQGLTHQLANVFGELAQISRKLDEKHGDIVGKMPQFPHDKVDAMTRRLDGIERNLDQVKRDVEGKDYRENLNQINQAIESVRGGLTDHLPDTIGQMLTTSSPKMGMFVFIVLAVQIMLAGAYIVYKRRRASMPKKYL